MCDMPLWHCARCGVLASAGAWRQCDDRRGSPRTMRARARDVGCEPRAFGRFWKARRIRASPCMHSQHDCIMGTARGMLTESCAMQQLGCPPHMLRCCFGVDLLAFLEVKISFSQRPLASSPLPGPATAPSTWRLHEHVDTGYKRANAEAQHKGRTHAYPLTKCACAGRRGSHRYSHARLLQRRHSRYL